MALRDEEDIDEWVEALSGGPRRDQRDSENREILQLRNAIGSYAEKMAQQSLHRNNGKVADDTSAWHTMRFRLRRDRLVMPQRQGWGGLLPTAVMDTLGGRWAIALPSAAIGALVLAISLGPQISRMKGGDSGVIYDDAPRLRGEPRALELAVGEPLASAQRVARILKQNDAKSTIYFASQIAVVDFDLNADTVAAVNIAVKQQFAELHLQSGFNRVIFKPNP